MRYWRVDGHSIRSAAEDTGTERGRIVRRT